MVYAIGYGPSRTEKSEIVRLQLRIPKTLLNKIDGFGIPSGFTSRNLAVIHLLETAISETKKASDQPASNPDASTTTP